MGKVDRPDVELPLRRIKNPFLDSPQQKVNSCLIVFQSVALFFKVLSFHSHEEKQNTYLENRLLTIQLNL